MHRYISQPWMWMSFFIWYTVDKNNQMLTIYIFCVLFEYFQIKFHLQFVVTIVHNEDYLRTGFDVNRPKQLISQWCPRYPWNMTCHAILFILSRTFSNFTSLMILKAFKFYPNGILYIILMMQIPPKTSHDINM